MFKEYEDSISYIYENEQKFKDTTDRKAMRIQSSELTGSDSVKIRNYGAAVVCLVVLCVLLLTAVIVLCVTLTQAKRQLIVKNANLTNERDQLRNELQITVQWTCYKLICYYMSNDTKSWNDSRRYCKERGADLIIINSQEEHDFVAKMFAGTSFWIGLTDSEVEGSWKWVDGSNMTSAFSFWWSGEPSGRRAENCVAYWGFFGWFDESCDYNYQWICEKRIL